MIETILSGLPTVLWAIFLVLCSLGIAIVVYIGFIWLWKHNRILGYVTVGLCIIGLVLSGSYIVGLGMG